MRRPIRWWTHRHRPVRAGWVGLQWFERCSCGAGRFYRGDRPRPWIRLDPWPPRPVPTPEETG